LRPKIKSYNYFQEKFYAIIAFFIHLHFLKKITMKKSILFFVASAMMAFTACGPSAEQKAAAEKAAADSIAAVEAARIQDSIATAQAAAQEAEALAQKATEDSLKMKAMEDSIAAAKTPTKKPTVKKPTTPKPAAAAKATLTEEEKKLPAKVQEKILKKRQQMLDDAAKK
jgi:hypothetical protein